MRRRLALALLACPLLLPGQAEFRVYTEHPRLFLEPDRLRRLERDVGRETIRWRRLAQLVADGAPLTEPDVAHALVYRLTGREEIGRRAIAGVERAVAAGTLGSPGRLRQAALVFDWCYDLLDDQQRTDLAPVIGEEAARRAELAGLEVAPVRDGVLAAIAVADDWDGSEAVLGAFLDGQWRQEILPIVGEITDDTESLIALLEICHAVRHNLERNLWVDAPGVFDTLPASRVLSYEPGSIETDEGRLRLSALGPSDAEARERDAVLGRIAEMMLVAYAPNPRGSQFLQGWLHNDSYTLTGQLGALYEFLWINPYLPGLSPAAGLNLAYDSTRGRLFARTGWEEDDYRLFYSNDGLRILRGSGERVPADELDHLVLPGATVMPAIEDKRFEAPVEAGESFTPRIYLIGLKSGGRYSIRVNRNDWRLVRADGGGILEIFSDPANGVPEIKFDKPVKIQLRRALEDPPGRKRPTLN